jgi:amidase
MGPDATHLVGLSAGAIADLVRAREVTARQVVRAHLTQIAATDGPIGAFQKIRAEKALSEAEALAVHDRLDTLPLAGVPVAIKDNVPVAGEPMRVGSLATSERPSDADHVLVSRLRTAGAIVVGTTCLPELCVWSTTDGAFGITRNPWNPGRTAGGSSGGSAAAVSSAMVPLALGADGLGSIRIPAASCGVFGLKPGTGVLPGGLGVSSWYGMAENGPIATTVGDAALMLSVLAGREEFRDPAPPERPLRIAVSTSAPVRGIRVDRELEQVAVQTGDLLAGASHSVEYCNSPRAGIRTSSAVFARWFAGVAQDAAELDSSRLERRTRTHVRLGRIAQRLGMVRAQDRDHWRRLLEPLFRRFDLLLTPMLATTPIAAGPWAHQSWRANVLANVRFAPFAAPWNFAGFPAAAIPAGTHSDGMPLSVQLVASTGRERVILSVARQLELLRPWPRHPKLATPAR